MDAIERIMELCKERRIPVSRLEKDLGFSNGYLKNLTKGKISAERLFAIAEYFDVSPEWLMTGNETDLRKQSITGTVFYFNDDTAEIAQNVFDDPDLRLLFEAARGSKSTAIRLAAEMLRQMKDTNPDG